MVINKDIPFIPIDALYREVARCNLEFSHLHIWRGYEIVTGPSTFVVDMSDIQNNELSFLISINVRESSKKHLQKRFLQIVTCMNVIACLPSVTTIMKVDIRPQYSRGSKRLSDVFYKSLCTIGSQFRSQQMDSYRMLIRDQVLKQLIKRRAWTNFPDNFLIGFDNNNAT